MFVTRDAENISNLLAFIGRHIKMKMHQNEDEHEMTEKFTPDPRIKNLIGEEGRQRFYLIRTKKLGNISLLQYIVENAPMAKQREELLDLLAKKIECDYEMESGIKRVNYSWVKYRKIDEESTERKIITNLKLGLPSSIKLSECIKMTEEKFRWSTTKAAGLIAVSVLTTLFSLSLYLADVAFDVKFVQEMFENSHKDFAEQQTNYTDEFYDGLDIGCQNYCARDTGDRENCFDFFENKTLIARRYREAGPRFEDPDMFRQNAIYTLVHCISPFLFIILAWLHTMRGSHIGRLKKKELAKVPLPLISRIYKLILEIKKIKLRSKFSFNEDVKKADDDIVDYEDTINLSSSIEAATEASPQFFFQTVYSIPTVIISFVGYHGWRELVSYKMLSIAFSFTSVAFSNYFIR